MNLVRTLILRSIPLVAVLILTSCSKSPVADARLAPPLVMTTQIVNATTSTHVFTGVVMARVESNLGFRISGKVIQRQVDVGQQVSKGQLLMRLDSNDQILNHSTQQAAVAVANAKYTKAVADEARLNGLSELGAISAQTYDAVKAALDAAKAELNAAKAQANLARNADNYTDLVADTDGVIVGVFAEPGQVVTTGQAVVRIAKNGPREAEVYFPENVRPDIGSEATATLYGDATTMYNVSLRELSQAADPISRTFTARYIIPQSSKLLLGSTVSVALNVAEKNVVQIPLSAIYNDGINVGVWVVDADSTTVSLRTINIQKVTSEQAFVEGVFTPDEKIVALGAHLLHEGELVKLANNSKVVLK